MRLLWVNFPRGSLPAVGSGSRLWLTPGMSQHHTQSFISFPRWPWTSELSYKPREGTIRGKAEPSMAPAREGCRAGTRSCTHLPTAAPDPAGKAHSHRFGIDLGQLCQPSCSQHTSAATLAISQLPCKSCHSTAPPLMQHKSCMTATQHKTRHFFPHYTVNKLHSIFSAKLSNSISIQKF